MLFNTLIISITQTVIYFEWIFVEAGRSNGERGRLRREAEVSGKV